MNSGPRWESSVGWTSNTTGGRMSIRDDMSVRAEIGRRGRVARIVVGGWRGMWVTEEEVENFLILRGFRAVKCFACHGRSLSFF